MEQAQYLMCDFVRVLYNWQTLVGSVLALFGAWLTVRGINSQLNQAQTFEDQRNKREERAAKAVLPLALSELMEYSNCCMKFLKNNFLYRDFKSKQEADLFQPSVSGSILSIFQNCAKYSDQITADQIHQLLLRLQIQNSRLKGLILQTKEASQPQITYDAKVAILDAAELHARCIDIFAYARDSDNPQYQMTFQEKLNNALFFADIHDDELNEMIKNRKDI